MNVLRERLRPLAGREVVASAFTSGVRIAPERYVTRGPIRLAPYIESAVEDT